jgi:MtaA/CmuA family methyltransferase
VDRLRPIDLTGDGLLPAMVEATRIIADAVGDRVCILAEADQGPFSLASQIVGIEEFLVALMEPDQAEHVERLLDYTTEQCTVYARALIDAGAHMTMMGESIAGPDVCAPDVYRRVAQPHERRVIEALAAEGKAMGLHICGNATAIVSDMADTGARFLQLDYKVDRATVKAATQGRTTLIGTVDPSGVLALGSPDDVRVAAQADIDILAPGGGYMLAPGCALPYGTPEANVEALIAAAHESGSYDAVPAA